MLDQVISKLRTDTTKDLIWSFAATGIRLGGGLIVLPFILTKFSPEELGLWYFFSTVGVFVLMIDTGFSVTISRNFRYVIAEKKIFKYTMDSSIENILTISIEDFYSVSRRFYTYISVISIIILALISFYIIELIRSNGLELKENLIAWILYAISISLNLKYYFRGAVLLGLNKIHLSQKIEVFSTVFNYGSVLLFLFLNLRLISLALGVIVGLIVRIILYEIFIDIKGGAISHKQFFNTLKTLWPNAWRTGASNVLGYLIRYLSSYFITIYLSLKEMGSFGITFQIVTIITSVSSTWINTVYPLLTSYRAERKFKQFYLLYYSRFRLGILTYLILSVLFILLGQWILGVIKSNTTLLEKPYILFILTYMFIDFLVNTYGYIIMTGNRIPFLSATFVTAILIILFNITFHYFNMSLWGVLLSTCLAGCCYNYWYWIYHGYKEVGNMIKEENFLPQ